MKKLKEEPVIFNRVVFDTDKEYSQKELDTAIKEAVEEGFTEQDRIRKKGK